jgi:hypothetical protein
VYLPAHLAFRLRNIGSVNYPRLVTAVLLLLAPLAVLRLPAVGQLAVLAAVMVALIAFETVHYADARRAIRHGTHRQTRRRADRRRADRGRVERDEMGYGLMCIFVSQGSGSTAL